MSLSINPQWGKGVFAVLGSGTHLKWPHSHFRNSTYIV
ncbi:hypothetical protein VPUCM_21192 [Vibrio parahaemolyticus UCM-V493]|nr:hypothetical protein VPUCM_21192 [Vibrio parahaemolyticus UCM-V493]